MPKVTGRIKLEQKRGEILNNIPCSYAHTISSLIIGLLIVQFAKFDWHEVEATWSLS
jgi:hypothetical protein